MVMNPATRIRQILFVASAAVVLSSTVVTDANAPAGRYVIASGTVYDTLTKLTWQQTLAGADSGTPISYTWANAESYCASLGSGWRMPTIKELATIADVTQSGPCIDTTAFPGTPAAYFWSSTPHYGSTVLDMGFDYPYIYATTTTPSDTNYVRCVR